VLAAAERELVGEPVVFIGVHSPKFPTEGDPARVRDAVRRHGVTHPVVVDPGYAIWSAYAIRAWPTLVFVRPDGTIHGLAAGEPERQPLVGLIRGLLDEQRSLLDPAPLPLRPEPAPPGSLAFPGGIAVGPPEAEPGGFYVADTGHHQIVVCAADGRETGRFGDGSPGLRDGPTAHARFTHPHGLSLDSGGLLVADTSNHAVRRVDLDAGEVTTVAGTGRKGNRVKPGPARSTDLRSPWDVTVDPSGSVVVAMAGSHQLWAVERPGAVDSTIRVLAGSGREARVDGDYAEAAFAQPSGLAWGPGPHPGHSGLYVADSEISAIRKVVGGRVDTLAGGDLFDFGDVDGVGDEVRLQHPVGIAAASGGALDALLLIADTLNHKVKSLDPRTGRARTLFGDGTAFDAALAVLEGAPTVPAGARRKAFCREPEALAWDGRRVLVVDTGNHRVLAVDPTDGSVTVLVGGDTATPMTLRAAVKSPR
jgi:sugar lactone lactonase YvrE